MLLNTALMEVGFLDRSVLEGDWVDYNHEGSAEAAAIVRKAIEAECADQAKL